MGVWAGRRGASAGRRGMTRRVSWASEKRWNDGHPPWRSRWARHGLRLGHCIWCRSCRGRSGSCPLSPLRALWSSQRHREPFPVNALRGVICHQDLFPSGHEDVRLCPRLEAAMGGTTGTDACLVQSIPLASRAEHAEDGIHRPPIIEARSMIPEGFAACAAGAAARYAPTTR
jgi:hypothetical protein